MTPVLLLADTAPAAALDAGHICVTTRSTARFDVFACLSVALSIVAGPGITPILAAVDRLR